MRVLFIGPSLSGYNVDLSGIERRPPARQGDIRRAVDEGATAIGLVDGYFGRTAAVWHKELLYALSVGVRVLGAASIGALRAAECGFYGMEPVGRIARAYQHGELVDDDAVALLHGPPELDYVPFTEALVDVQATLERLLQRNQISQFEAGTLAQAAKTLHFTQRQIDAVLARADLPADRRAELALAYQRNRTSQKLADALELISLLHKAPARRGEPPQSWTFAESPVWRTITATAA
jgi:hypothetical protein